MDDCVEIPWPLYPLALVAWLVLVPVFSCALLLGWVE